MRKNTIKVAYFDCLSGLSGDMTLGVLLDLGVPLGELNDAVRSVLESIKIESEQAVRKGFRVTLAKVEFALRTYSSALIHHHA